MNDQARFAVARADRVAHAPVAGIELGGTKCVCTLAHDPDTIIAQHSVSTTTPAETLAAIERVLAGWWADAPFRALGIGSFGPVDLDPGSARHGHILATTKPGWSGTDVRAQLSARYPVPVAFDTDVNAAAMAELRWGAGRGFQDFAYVTVGTGIGVGLIVHGHPTRGIGHSELGHIRVPRLAGDAAASVCPFHDDCVEGLASGTAIKARLGSDHVSAIATDHPVWEPVVHTLAQLCHVLVCATGPHRIAIGGGVLTGQPHLLARIESALIASLAGYLRLPDGGPYIVAPELGGQAGPMGTIALADRAMT